MIRSGLQRSPDISENKVIFVNVKTNYLNGEDLILDYTLHEEFKSSTRDWIGIFPRNWSNLQQYLTFEYTLSAPANAANSSSRTISFPRIFHREAPLNLEHQFVYVSKEIQIVATSSYFRFVPSLNVNTMNGRPCATTNISTNAAVSTNTTVNKTEVTQDVRPTCRYCHRKVCGLKIDALRGDFLATWSDSLLNRVHRLEGDLSFAESALRNAKGARENLAKRLQAYEAFVAEMLKSLAVRGVVKITDEKGTEIILRRVNSENHRMAEGDGNSTTLEDEIVALKRLLEIQQRTIADLELEKFDVVPQSRDRVDREIQTSFDPDENFEPVKDQVKRNDVEKSCDERREKNESRKIMVNTKQGKLCLDTNVKDKKIIAVDAENVLFGHVEGISSSSSSSSSRTKGEKFPLDVYGKKFKEIGRIDSSKLFARDVERGRNCLNHEAEQVVLKIPKPSGILVQGKDVKFAIVRL